MILAPAQPAAPTPTAPLPGGAGLCAAMLAALVAAAPVAAQDAVAAAAGFVAVAQANGCTLTEAEGETLLPAAGLSMGDARAAVLLLNRGALFTVDPDGLTLRLVPGLCAADAETAAAMIAAAASAEAPRLTMLALHQRIDPERGARLVALVRAQGCRLSEARAEALLPAAGFTAHETADIAALLVGMGQARLEANELTLSAPVCAAEGPPDLLRLRALLAEAAQAEGEGDWPEDPAAVVAAFEDELRTRGCGLDLAEPGIVLPPLAGRIAERLGPGAPAADAILAVLDIALGLDDPHFIHAAGQLRLADCTP